MFTFVLLNESTHVMSENRKRFLINTEFIEFEKRNTRIMFIHICYKHCDSKPKSIFKTNIRNKSVFSVKNGNVLSELLLCRQI